MQMSWCFILCALLWHGAVVSLLCVQQQSSWVLTPCHLLGSPAVILPAGVLLMACSTDPFQLVDAGVAAAAALSGGAAPRAAKQLPASLDGFGWCAASCLSMHSFVCIL
jgi:hypothetical protein